LRESELKMQAEFERAKRSEEARAAEEAARRSAHAAALKAAQEAARRAGAEARKQAELVKQREAAAQKAREDAIKAAEAAKQARIPAPVAVPALAEAETLYQQAMAMESSGNAGDAMRIYRRAARAGNGKAAKRLGDIFDCGVPGVRRDYAESLQWYEIAFSLGESVSTVGNRDGRACPRAAQ
jgi:colicin import membrane protein